MTLDPTFKYFLVGKATAQALSHAQAESLGYMPSIFTATLGTDPVGAGADYWMASEPYYGEPNFTWAESISFEPPPHDHDTAQVSIATKYVNPNGTWTPAGPEMLLSPDKSTGLFLVALKGPAAALFVPVTGADFEDFTSWGDYGARTIVFGYSNTDGGQFVYITATESPYLIPSLLSEIQIYAAYDAPPPPPAFWTDFIGAHESP